LNNNDLAGGRFFLAQIIANSGHFIPEEQPQALARELHTFFTM
jgi:pimeloyl-ACP methyl ester carboxylesterase